jgi:hypothetical protein
MKPYLFSYTHGIGDEFPIAYQLVYSDNAENALILLKLKMYNKIYDIENCTIE